MQLDKRGQELSVNTLILIIIGVLVLVFLIIGFRIGWEKVFPFIAPANNVKDVTDKCSLACSTNAVYDFCTASREVHVDQEIKDLGKKFSGSCYELRGVTQLGVEACPGVQCKDFVYSSETLAKLSCATTAATGDANLRTYVDATATATGGKSTVDCSKLAK